MSDLLSTYQQRNWGTDHVYLRNNDLANVWEDLTGKKTVSSSDIANLRKLIDIIVENEVDQPRERVDYDQLILDSGQLPTGYLGELD